MARPKHSASPGIQGSSQSSDAAEHLATVTVKDFKSLKDVHVELGQVNVFVGANGAGKSCLLEAVGILSKSMTTDQFDRGYWYSTDLKEFAETIGIRSARKLRKDELEKAIRAFLGTGQIESPPKRALSKSGVKDIEQGLRLDLPIVNYTSNKETKAFIEKEASRLVPGLRKRSGVRYRLNRWREEQLTHGRTITYGDLVRRYVELSQAEEPFARIPHGRYINFVADFLAGEEGATRAAAIHAWEELKGLDVPKDYRSWARHHASTRR
jgi:energy-coupling factor transporter ATP-binding protein EcfA2